MCARACARVRVRACVQVGEIYEWLEGPIAEHFVCEEPPRLDGRSNVGGGAGWAASGQPMCWLPSGSFLSDNLIELRQVRVRPMDDARLAYFTAGAVPVLVDGAGLPYAGVYSNPENRDTRSPWVLRQLLVHASLHAYSLKRVPLFPSTSSEDWRLLKILLTIS